MGAGLQKTLFAPNLLLPDTVYGSALAIASIAIGTLFIFFEPFFVEFGIALAVLFFAGFLVVPVGEMLEALIILGLAV